MKQKLILSVIPLFLVSVLSTGCTDKAESIEPATQETSIIHRFSEVGATEEEAQSAADAAKRAAEEEAQKKADEEAQKKAKEEEAARVAAEEEAARIAAEEEAARVAAEEAEAARVAAEEEAARIAAEEEAARVAAEQEAVRFAEQQANQSVYYKNCTAARDAGPLPCTQGTPATRSIWTAMVTASGVNNRPAAYL